MFSDSYTIVNRKKDSLETRRRSKDGLFNKIDNLKTGEKKINRAQVNINMASSNTVAYDEDLLNRDFDDFYHILENDVNTDEAIFSICDEISKIIVFRIQIW